MSVNKVPAEPAHAIYLEAYIKSTLNNGKCQRYRKRSELIHWQVKQGSNVTIKKY